MATLAEYAAAIRERIPEALVDVVEGLDMGVLVVRPEALVEVVTALRDAHGFDMLLDLSAADWLPREPRYDVNYHLESTGSGERLRVKVQLPDAESPRVESVVGVWPTANWHEREVFDFFG